MGITKQELSLPGNSQGKLAFVLYDVFTEEVSCRNSHQFDIDVYVYRIVLM